ncbi:uncharacterized protein LOC111267908 isoform X2 [Varroa jacobsoni]|uniref:Uncharacterized protein n=1 Tax=Varroa destructor TaxID=109461 RepID=A0A7M7KQ87_VARDE|nr:uncharacterized protein LOC111254089 [Varroa destructor]XP_022702220.1 uncharacterized protein LOC111267908 isoform X2 [Varroa jacobsoni]
MLLIRYTLVLATAIVGSAFAWFGPLAPFDDYGKLYELGLSGGTYYGYQYVPRHPGHANVPAKRADLNVSIAVKKPPIVRQAAPFLHGQGKGQFNVVSRAFESTDARKLSKPFLTPVTRNNNGYAYHRVPLALVQGGFVGHHLGIPVVHGIVEAGVPVSLAPGL